MDSCECGEPPCVVVDWSRGERVCQRCGVVVESHLMDEADRGWEQWEQREQRDPNVALSQMYSPRRQDSCVGTPLIRTRHDRQDRQDRQDIHALHEGLRLVDHAVSAFALSTTCAIAATAKELFRDVCELRVVRPSARPAMVAAALYHAFKMEGTARELDAVSRMCGVEPSALRAASNEYKAALVHRPYYARLFARAPAEAHLDVFLNRLGLETADRKRLWRAARELMERLGDALDCGRKPRTVCCGVMYVAAKKHRIAVSKTDLASACSVCLQTLDKVVAYIRKAMCERK